MKKIALAAVAAVVLTGAGHSAGPVMDKVMERGSINCGVSQGLPGFSNPDDAGTWTGLDVEFCRAMAAGLFGDANAVNFVPLSAKARFSALTSGEVDVLPRNTTWTLSRDAGLGINFVGVNFYDGQGMMVRKDLGVSSATELDGASVCTNTGTTTELNITDYFRQNNMDFELIAFEVADEVVAAYDAGRCDVYTTDRSGLAAQRTKLTDPDAHVVLPETISKEPLGPVVAEGDAVFEDIARWTLNIVINAEEMGVSSSNVAEMASSDNPSVQRLLDGVSESLGVEAGFGGRVIAAVGNYGEMYERNITPIGLSRGVNALWNQGGILYAPPVR